MILDLAILALLLLGVIAGYRSGFIALALGQIGVVTTLALLSRADAIQTMPGGIFGGLVMLFLVGSVAGAIGAQLARFIRRIPILRGVDVTLGAIANAVLTLAVVYLVLAAVATFDDVLIPLHRASAIGPGQAAGLEARSGANPALGLVVDAAGMTALTARARIAAVPLDALEQYEPGLAFYEFKIRPQLVSSVLLPWIMRIGMQLPVIGQPASPPRDFPRDQPPSN